MTYYLQAYRIVVVIVYTAAETEFCSILRISPAKTKYTRFLKFIYASKQHKSHTIDSLQHEKKQPNEL